MVGPSQELLPGCPAPAGELRCAKGEDGQVEMGLSSNHSSALYVRPGGPTAAVWVQEERLQQYQDLGQI